MLIKLLTVVGARPQFIKAATVSRAIRHSFSKYVEERIVHTGQHFDANMSAVFFDQMEIPLPFFNLGVSGGGHGAMTGKMLGNLESLFNKELPDVVLTYGDTNSTLAGALAAAKLHIPVVHVEAGLRSFNMKMPEEINRILSDRLSAMLLCPTESAVNNLAAEGIKNGVYNTGDVMFDAALFYGERAGKHSTIISDLELDHGDYVLATCHRAENTDNPDRLAGIFQSLATISSDKPVVMPLHPRTKKYAETYGLNTYLEHLKTVPPVSFFDMVVLEKHSYAIITDSGGVQKEAFFYGVPCITMRDETEWTETVAEGGNKLVGSSPIEIAEAYSNADIMRDVGRNSGVFGNGRAAEKVVDLICSHF